MFPSNLSSDRTRLRSFAAVLITAVLATVFVLASGTAEARSVIGKFNFQPEGAPTPRGFAPDTGQPYADGRGWVRHVGDEPARVADNAHHRAVSGDKRVDTHINMTQRRSQWGKWELAVPNGSYDLWITVGNVAAPGTRHALDVEGQTLIDWVSSAPQPTRAFHVFVDVADGKLTYRATGNNQTHLVATTVALLEPADASPSEPEQTTTTVEQTTTTVKQTTTTTAPRTQSTTPEPADAPAPTDGTVGSIAGFAPGGHFTGMSRHLIVKELDLMQASGATWLRFPFMWQSFESRKDNYRFAKHDFIVTEARKRGISIIANVAYTPKWARAAGCDVSKCPPAPEHLDEYAELVTVLADHFGPMGVTVFEVWNEPNHKHFWHGGVDPAYYTRMLKLTYRTVKAKHPEVHILAGSLAPAATKNGNVNGVDFVEAMYRNGAKGHFDGLSYHPYNYPAAPEKVAGWHSFTGVIPAIQDVMIANGDRAKSRNIWGTEYGYHTADHRTGVSEATQADYVGRSYTEWQKISDAPLIWFNLRDTGTDRTAREQNWGILRHDFNPKKGWSAWKQAMRQPLR